MEGIPDSDREPSYHHSKRSFHPKGKRTASMEGIRLRSDSDGSMKSAFYQGTIVSSPPGSNLSRRTTNKRTKETKSRPVEQEKSFEEVANMVAVSFAGRQDLLGGRATSPSTSRRSISPLGGQANPQLTSELVSSVAQGFTPMFDMTSPAHAVDEDESRASKRGSLISSSSLISPNQSRNDSLRYSDISISSQQILLGMDFLQASDATMLDPGALTGEALGLDPDGFGSDPSLGGLSNRRDSTGRSDVYFNQPLPPGPFQPGLSPYPMQHTPVNNNFPNYKAITPKNHGKGRFAAIDKIDEGDEMSIEERDNVSPTFSERPMHRVERWLTADVKFDEDGTPYFEDNSRWTVRGVIRDLLYNPVHPEFTSLQQFSWAVLIGIFMGVYTAVWKTLIEACVNFMWKDVPERLLKWGIFTDLDGNFPIYHYMWIVPGLFSGTLSYIFEALPIPIPGQNEWIHNLHSRGVQTSDTFGPLFLLSTAGMASGLSLGPELPLILTAGMIGSWLGVLCKQSMLQARVLNLTAASAAIGGFFGFPMAGALFVLEIPHRMGLQYFEALSPATIASIVAVLTNRLVTGNDVTGYYEYPFLNESLPSQIFKHAIVYGLFGGALGIFYTKVVLVLKHLVQDMFQGNSDAHHGEDTPRHHGHWEETVPLVGNPNLKMNKDKSNGSWNPFATLFACAIPHKPTRAAVSGTLVGIVVGVTCMFIPHVMFWGEAQLQSLIDKGRTPLPVFGRGDEPSAGLVALGYCLIDEESAESVKSGFSLGCSAAITLAKIFVTGLSLGTGIVGGHFWAPLFVGCAASHFLTDLVDTVAKNFGVSSGLSEYPCVALLCIMGSTHVVTFRAHIAIILILTLTIDAFDPKGDVGGEFKVAGDYSAVFPLLTVAVFVALQISRKTVFYEKQRSRGDIMALPEVLCEPGKEGKPLVMDYKGDLHELDESIYGYESDTDEASWSSGEKYRTLDSGTSQYDIEADFEVKNQANARGMAVDVAKPSQDQNVPPHRKSSNTSSEGSSGRAPSPLPPRPQDNKSRLRSLDDLLNGPIETVPTNEKRHRRLDDLLNGPIETVPANEKRHRRTRSEPFGVEEADNRTKTMRNKKADSTVPSLQRKPSGGVTLKRVNSFGQVDQEQPSLLDQARRRAASFEKAGERYG